jgi:hypothetical protein
MNLATTSASLGLSLRLARAFAARTAREDGFFTPGALPLLLLFGVVALGLHGNPFPGVSLDCLRSGVVDSDEDPTSSSRGVILSRPFVGVRGGSTPVPFDVNPVPTSPPRPFPSPFFPIASRTAAFFALDPSAT